jgi:hypothetical protein
MKAKSRLALVFAVGLVVPQLLQAQETSRVIPFNNLPTSLPASTTQSVTAQLWDVASGGTTPLFSEGPFNVNVDANGNISFVFGSLTTGGLDPANFPSGTSRFLDVVDGTGASVLPNGRVALNATAFALSPGPQGPPGSQGPPGDPGPTGPSGPPGAVQSVTAGNTSISIGGSVANPTVAVATNGITNTNIADEALGQRKIQGVAATLTNTNFFFVNQRIGGNRLDAQIGDMACGFGQSGLGSAGFSVGNPGLCTNYNLLGDAQNTFLNRPSGGTLYFREGNTANQMVIAPGGNVGIGINNPAARLDVAGRFADVMIGDPNCGGGQGTAAIGFVSGPGGLDCVNNFALGGNTTTKGTFINRPTGGAINFVEGNGTPQMIIQPGGEVQVKGTTTTGILQIVGGSDLSERFEVSALQTSTETRIEPGMVVSIDPKHPGRLIVSSTPYDRRAAGVISGAGGIKPGMLMGQSGSVADGDLPVSLAGRVYCLADATNGSIEPSDLLTTSGTPGHAMKVTDRRRAQGSIIGKALTGLREGKGLILILVTLR